VSRPIALLGAASSLGIRPYDDGTPRGRDRAPERLRERGLAARLGAEDLGDVTPPPYRDYVRPPHGVRNERELVAYSTELAARVEPALAGGRFVVLLGGDCSIVLGALAGARRGARGPVGLAYVDGHADFATPAESITGSAASMDLALAIGRGDSPLARMAGEAPLVAHGDVVLLGRRDHAEPWYGHDARARSAILDLPREALRGAALRSSVDSTLTRLARPELAGFWIHFDADVLDERVMPAVDSPAPDGLSPDEAVELLARLAGHPKALGLQVTIYDPALDRDGTSGDLLAGLLERALAR
jgi:arginase